MALPAGTAALRPVRTAHWFKVTQPEFAQKTELVCCSGGFVRILWHCQSISDRFLYPSAPACSLRFRDGLDMTCSRCFPTYCGVKTHGVGEDVLLEMP